MAGRSVLEGEVLERAVALGAGAPVAEKPDLTTVFPQLTDRGARGCWRSLPMASTIVRWLRRPTMGEGTVRNHISSILAKLGLRNRTQIAVAYWRALR